MVQVKLITLSVFLTLLLWMAADQLLTATATVQVMIQPVPAAGASITVSSASGRAEPFRVEVMGQRKIIDQFKQAPPLEISLPIESSTTGRINISVEDKLQNDTVRFGGLTVMSVRPKLMVVTVDRETTLMLPVGIDVGTLDYDVPPSVEPDRVEVTLSQETLKQIPVDRRRLIVPAYKHLKDKKRGILLEFDVPLEGKVAGWEVKLSRPHVKLRATLREQLKTGIISAVPIFFEGSVDLLNAYRIELRNPDAVLTQAISIKGPAESINRLVGGQIKVVGSITLSGSEAPGLNEYRFKRPLFHLPFGVELVDSDAVEPVEFRLIRRTRSPN